MKLIMLDTETTGLSPAKGDRMVEIGAIKMDGRKILSGKKGVFHHYINPDRDIPPHVTRIHGIDNARVSNFPRFGDIAHLFLEFIEGATLVIHNATFDLNFIMHELHLNQFPNIDEVPVIDTLALARKKHPNQKNNLDALCDRYSIERDHRELHGALLDSKLLAQVYLSLSEGEPLSLSQPASNFVQL